MRSSPDIKLTSPAGMIQAVRAVVHDRASAEEAFGVFEGDRAEQLRPAPR